MSTTTTRTRTGRALTAALVALGLAGTAPAAAQEGEDKALGQPASASSVERPRNGGACNAPGSCLPGFANDGDTGTRWSSEYTDDEFWQVDLGRARLVDSVGITWEPAYAERYRILTSLDGRDFSVAAEAVLALSAAERARLEVTRRVRQVTFFAERPARYVRVANVQRASRYGLSIWDVNVHGPDDALMAPPAPAPPAPPVPDPQPAPPAPPAAPGGRAPEPALRALSPAPLVRIKGYATRRGARIQLLTVAAPRGARVRVRCRGRSCPRRLRAPRARRGVRRYAQLQRFLRAGTRIEVFVTRRGTTGRYTRLVIRRNRAPRRTTRCVLHGTRKPIACP